MIFKRGLSVMEGENMTKKERTQYENCITVLLRELSDTSLKSLLNYINYLIMGDLKNAARKDTTKNG